MSHFSPIPHHRLRNLNQEEVGEIVVGIGIIIRKIVGLGVSV